MSQFLNPTPVPQPKALVQTWNRRRITQVLLQCWNGDDSEQNMDYIELLLEVLEQMD